MKRKKAFEQLCDELEENLQKKNKINIVRDRLKDMNANQLIEIKAEAEETDLWAYSSYRIGVITLCATGISILMPMFTDLQEELKNEEGIFWKIGMLISVICIIWLIVVAVGVIIEIIKERKFKAIRKWRKYILAVIDELIEKNQIQDQMYTYEIEIEDSLTHEKTVYTEKIKKTKY